MEADSHADRTVVVTGAASGIGRGIAHRFGEAGAAVIVADIRREPKQGVHYERDVTTPTDELIVEETTGDATFVQTDVSDPESASRMIDRAVETYGTVDVLVNNAGIHIPGDSQELTTDEWATVMGVNLDGMFYCAKAAVPHLAEREGHLINISSVNANHGGAGPAYASSKAGIVNLTRDLATELGPANVNVNAICPGYIETPMQDYLDADDIPQHAEKIPLPRFGTPEDIGAVALFLASEAAGYIHGAAITVDGGLTAHRG